MRQKSMKCVRLLGGLAQGTLILAGIRTDLSRVLENVGTVSVSRYLTHCIFGDAFSATLLVCLFAMAAIWAKDRFGAFYRKPSCLVAGLLMAMACLISDAGIVLGDVSLIWRTPRHLLFAVVKAAGYLVLWGNLANALWAGLDRTRGKEAKTRSALSLAGWILLLWSPWILVTWPGTVNSDAYDQIRQVFGTLFPDSGVTSRTAALSVFSKGGILINDTQPVLHTLALGGVYALFWKAGCAEVGIFLFVAVQCFLMALQMGRSLALLGRMGIRRELLRGLFLFYALFPLFPLYACATLKDAAFGMAFLGSVVFLAELFLFPEETVSNRRRMLGGAAMVFLMAQLRAFALWMLLAALVFAIPFVARWIRRKRAAGIAALCAVLLPMALSFLLTSVGYPALGVGRGPEFEDRSIMFQQTAAYARKYPEEIMPQEREAINRVLDCDRLAELYDPDNADPVKNTALHRISGEDMRAYEGAWRAQFRRHPGVYLEAALGMSMDYWDLLRPKFDTGLLIYQGDYSKASNPLERGSRSVPGSVEIHAPRPLQRLGKVFAHAVRLLAALPVTSLTLTTGLYICLFFLSLIYAAGRRRRGLALMLPLGLYILGLTLSPVSGSTRYAFPIYLISPLCALMASALPGRNAPSKIQP